MSQYGWRDCPADVRAQVNCLVDGWHACLADNLIGIYLHGSLAAGCFNPRRSDVDLLVVTHHQLAPEIKRSVAGLLLRVSSRPSRVEMSCLRRMDLDPWQHPTPYDFHYGEEWRDAIGHELDTGEWKDWNAIQRYDGDLAGHIVFTRHHGLCLYGQPIADVFSAIPAKDFLASILADVLSQKFGLSSEIEYPVYTVLNACRTYAYLKAGKILSKDEGGVWALENVPRQLRAVVMAALDAYRNDEDDSRLSKEAVAEFAITMRSEIERLLPAEPSRPDERVT